MKFSRSTGMRAASEDSIEQDGANSDATRDACANKSLNENDSNLELRLTQ